MVLYSLIVLTGCAGIFFAGMMWAWRYLDARRKSRLVMVVSALSVIIALFCCALAPVDVWDASSPKHPQAGHINKGYYALFGILSCWVGLVVPFTFSYVRQDEEDLPLCEKVANAGKATAGFALTLLVAFLVGLAMRPGHDKWSQKPDQRWIKMVLDTDHAGSAAILFTMGCLAVAGTVLWLVFTAYGIAALPMSLLKGKKGIEEESLDVEQRLVKVRHELKTLGAKRYQRKSDKDRIAVLQAQERQLTRHDFALQSHIIGKACGCIKRQYLAASVAPLRVGLGLAMLTMTLLVVGSIIATSMDQFLYTPRHACAAAGGGGGASSAKCTDAQKKSAMHWKESIGYLMKLSVPHAVPHSLFNPLDSLLLYVAQASSPLDTLLLGGVLAYLLAATFYGLVRLKFLCLPLYRIRRSATSPRGVLLLGAMLMVSALAIIVQLPTMAPQYATFGSQAAFSADQDKMEANMLEKRKHDKSGVPDEAAEKVAMVATAKDMGEQCRASLPHAIKGQAIFGALQQAQCGSGAMCCTTQIIKLVTSMKQGFPTFAFVFYLADWLFIFAVILWLLAFAFASKASNFTVSTAAVNGEGRVGKIVPVHLSSSLSLSLSLSLFLSFTHTDLDCPGITVI